MADQIILGAILFIMLIFFVIGKPRYDIVAIFGLIAATLFGLVPGEEAFRGFAHPAVITIAAVLILSRGLINAGVVDIVSNRLETLGSNITLQTAAITTLVAVCSAFMNNVGAVALLMPVAIQLARKYDRPPSMLLMPLAFGSLLGGLITLIGTPPNIIVAGFRETANASPFGMLDFAWVGIPVAIGGILFITFFSRFLVPRREGQTSREDVFHIEDYTTEVRVPADSKLAGLNLEEFKHQKDREVVIAGIIRDKHRILSPSRNEKIEAGDTLIVEAGTEDLERFLLQNGLELKGTQKMGEAHFGSDIVRMVETVIMPDSVLESKTVREMDLRWRYGVNLLAVARKGKRINERLAKIRFQAGDMLLLQIQKGNLHDTFQQLNLVMLNEREIFLSKKRNLLGAMAIFALAVGLSTFNLMRIEIALAGAAATFALFRFVKLRELYQSVDWPIVVFLGAIIPVAEALEPTGTADLISSLLLDQSDRMAPFMIVGSVLITTMLLANLVNKVSAVLMAPIAINMAQQLDVSADPLLMAVAIGATCAFLTPLGHQSNILVLGPGGYDFTDYWKLGLPLSIIVILISVPAILWAWPF
ncbi:SLC13 family permease [Rhodohalobacter barkolensis]|uniref:SLC13 family permease n=1 Tax=Rhodohalobacter barkolensis TaxID=2053187 RepID=UPI0010557C00|nr:SLC13 family permease [Rhodohalobacter barkolensis]